jgi:acyl dehydratase
MMGLPLEEIEVGTVLDLGSYQFTRENVLHFAQRFDPQAFHLDDEAAARGPFGRLAASGWHTAAAWMKCYIATNQAAEAQLRAAGKPCYATRPSPGFDNLKWIKPVYPGDTITYSSTITGKRDLASRPDLGMLFSLNEGSNQNGDLVFSFEGKVLAAKRAAS